MLRTEEEKILHTTVWILARTGVIQLLNIFLLGYLARNNAKELFGNVAIITISITAVTNLITQTFPSYIIYSRNQVSALMAGVVTSVLFAIILVLLSYLLINQEVIEMKYNGWFKILILKLPLDAYTSCVDASYMRDMRFRFIEKRDIVIQIVTICLALSLAVIGKALEALLLPMLSVSVLRAIVMLSKRQLRVANIFDIEECIRAVKYTKGLVGTSIANTFISEGDSFFVSKWFGPQSLGIYNISWRTGNIINRNLVSIVNRVGFPYLRKNSEELATKLLSIWKLISAIFIPLYVFLFFYAEVFIEILYGSQWREAVLPFKILLFFSLRMMFSSPINSALKVLGKTNLIMNVTILVIPLYLVSLYLGRSFGLVGIACGVMMSRNIGGLILMKKVANMLSIDCKKMFLVFIQPFLVSVLGCLLTKFLLVHTPLVLSNIDFLQFFLGLTIFALIYVGSMFVILPKSMYGLIHGLKKLAK